MLTEVLGDNPSGRLYKALVETKKTARACAYNLQLQDPGVLAFTAQLREDQSLEAAREALLTTVEEAAKTPFTEEEVNRAKTRLLKQVELIAQRLGARRHLPVRVGGDRRLAPAVPAPRPHRGGEARGRHPGGRHLPEDVQPHAGPVHPHAEAGPGGAAAAGGREPRCSRATRASAAVAQGEAFDPSPANIEARVQRSQLPGGLKVALLPKKTRGEMVTVALNLRWGTEQTVMGRGVRGEGGGLDADARHEDEEPPADPGHAGQAQGAGERGRRARGRARVSMETKRENLPEVLRLVAEVLREPAFDAKEFALLQQERLAAMEKSRSEPDTQGGYAYRRALGSHYPKGHPYYAPTVEEDLAGDEGA